MKKYLFPALAVIGFVLLLGAAGAADCGTLTTGQAAARGIVGLLLFGAGALNMRAKENAAAITSSSCTNMKRRLRPEAKIIIPHPAQKCNARGEHENDEITRYVR